MTPEGQDEQSVTVIVPTYNRSNYLPEAIESLLGQNRPPDQLLVVDDGSTDDTAEVLKRFGARIDYLHKANGGKSTALNLALRHARGSLIWIFDDDDVAVPDALRLLVDALRDNPDCGFAWGDYDKFTVDDAGQWVHSDPNLPNVLPQDLLFASLERSFVHQPAMLVRRHCYDEVGPFDETLVRSQDYEMLIRLARRYKAVHVPSLLFHQRHHQGARGSAGNRSTAVSARETWKSYDQLIFSGIHTDFALAEYAGRKEDVPLSPSDRLSALFHRFSLMARKGLWAQAGADLAEAAGIANGEGLARLARHDRDVLARVLDEYSYAPDDIIGTPAVADGLKLFRHDTLANDVRAALCAPLPWQIKAALKNRDWRKAAKLAGIFRSLGGLGALRAHLGRKIGNA